MCGDGAAGHDYTRLAFGMVSHDNEKQTSYSLDIVLQHCREVSVELNRTNNLLI